ncbi:hypothetical protein DERP_005854 [Dermatophagoides pteronyssinus]|uniref:Secreted peptide n=1 Tax=Dermatophagoides pteronyssinus TaxID=6956 RepID=A0ABQ8J9V4_DERPT|nr:hypothetical protein DERP_005854 [Dermatophagoides pteronyssinus]
MTAVVVVTVDGVTATTSSSSSSSFIRSFASSLSSRSTGFRSKRCRFSNFGMVRRIEPIVGADVDVVEVVVVICGIIFLRITLRRTEVPRCLGRDPICVAVCLVVVGGGVVC